ncbi:MAG: hypothetical protein IJA16_01460 [Clostridia bacterium]|nr:hypothetical protein [Clostridia bacterium]
MKKFMVSLILSISSSVVAFANEATDTEVIKHKINVPIFIVASVIVILGIIAVSVMNYIAYHKTDLKDLLSKYDAVKRRGQSRQRNYGQRNNYSNEHFDQINRMNEEENIRRMNEEFMRQATEEGIKSVTPFDHGGYAQGPGFNPSDTMANDAMNNQMNNMF